MATGIVSIVGGCAALAFFVLAKISLCTRNKSLAQRLESILDVTGQIILVIGPLILIGIGIYKLIQASG